VPIEELPHFCGFMGDMQNLLVGYDGFPVKAGAELAVVSVWVCNP
jgi:hypothetical protein